jgi:F-type H+-transporting ATPase subunit a
MADTHPVVAQVEPAPQHGNGEGGGHHGHAYSFEALQGSHNMPYPAIEPVHGWRPILMLNKADYAKINYHLLSQEAGFAAATPSVTDLKWAKDVADGQWTGREGDLAKAMTLAGDKSILTLPRELSFFNHQTFWSTVALTLGALLLLVFARRRPEQVKPANRIQHAIEALVLFVRDDIVRPNIKHHADVWVPYFGAFFLALLVCNLFGLVPIFGTATGNIGVTAAFACTTAALMLFQGIKNNGPIGFFTHLVPVPWSWNPFGMVLWFFLFAIEIFSLVARPVILAIRLFANMLAGHSVLLVFATLGFVVFSATHAPSDVGLATTMGGVGWILTIPFYGLELLVALLQAYIFVLLSAVFIGMCAHPEH